MQVRLTSPLGRCVVDPLMASGASPSEGGRRAPIAPVGSLTSGREVGQRGEVKERGRPKPKLETASSLG